MARKILIVDDGAINRQMLANVLQKDYDILEAENGRQAIALMHRHYKMLSAVLLDIVMPEMDGYTVLRLARENAVLSQIPIIMVTGSEDEDSRVKALSLGANDFILKPFNPEIVKHCLRNNIALRETASILNAIQKDKLTGLYNREAFFERVTAMVREQEPGHYILSCFDIDKFKLINDQYGAVEGDRILREIGAAIRASMDGKEGLAGRISADNFAALIPAAQQDTEILQKIIEKRLIVFEPQSIAFSVGRYLITDTTLPASAMYDRAYIAKQSIKGRYDIQVAYFDEVMLQKLARDQQIVGEMEMALMERQFEIWFQPQVNHATGALVGAEALVRWRHPKRGMISPGDFIPLFEQNGFIYELDKYVWREACRYLRQWMDAGFSPLPVSVNVSRYDIYRADLIEVVTGLIREYALPTELLRLEITESAFAQSTQQIVGIIDRFVSLGFTVEIDDFGSGYSSLNTLKSVPAQIVKLDMRFLEGDDDAQRGGSILESIVRMTKWLGMSVIAEGVETKEQGDFLKSIGCTYVQGYLYARPMPAADYEAHVQNARKETRVLEFETVDNLDNNQFWSPQSIDSMIFNSYVGAACIYEARGGNFELLRATDKYARMLGGEDMTVDTLLRLDLMDYLDPVTGPGVLARVDASARDKREMTEEFLFLDLPGCPHETYIRSTMRVIASTGDRYLVYCISDNITAQRLSERSERRLAKQLQAIMDNINCGITAIVLHEDSLEYVLTNDKYYELLGYTRAQYWAEIGDRGYMTLDPADRLRVQKIVERTRRTGKPTSLEYRAVRRDGSIIWLRSYLSMSSFEEIEGDVQLCTYADITAERHAAQDLLDNLPCGAGICAVSGDDAYMTYLNKRYLTYFRQSREANGDISAFAAVHPDDRANLQKAMQPALERGGEGSCVVRIADGPGDYIPFRVSGVSLQSQSDAKTIYVTFVPISHEELSFGEMLSVALETMMGASSALTFVKDRNLRYVCCSRSFAQLAGCESEKEIVGKTDFDLFAPELAERYVADDHRLMESRESVVDKVEALPSVDGRARYSCTSKCLLYDSQGNVIGLYGTGHDITQTRETETQNNFLINCIPGGVAVYEGAWSAPESIRLTYFSDGFCRLFGYTREEYMQLGAQKPTALVAEEDLPGLDAQLETLVRGGTPIDYVYRAHTKDGAIRWIQIKAVPGEKSGNTQTVYAVLFDVTERQRMLEQLQISEEENRLAISHSRNVVCRYDVASHRLKVSPSVSSIFHMSAFIENVPYAQVEAGAISQETASAYTEFYEKILRGEKSGATVFQRTSAIGWRWIEAHSSTVFSSDGQPVSAVISFADVTENFERDVVYKKWLQSLRNKESALYSLYRCNINKRRIFDTTEGSLLKVRFRPGTCTMEEHTEEYAAQYVLEDDVERFRAFLDPDTLLERYQHGELLVTLEYREKMRVGGYRWLSLTVDMVEYPHSSDVEAYLLFEDIDETKRAELLTIERAETDPLTGVLNRTTFAEKANAIIRASHAITQHALLLLDIDGFKMVNDGFGHAAGDQTLIEVATTLRAISRREDLVGRLGGDEFMLFLADIPGERIAAAKARQICEMTRKAFSAEVQISCSVGVALCQRDGADFETLYHNADETLYHVKKTGRDNYAFYHKSLPEGSEQSDASTPRALPAPRAEKKRRMLIVDDSAIDFEFHANIFKDDFIIEQAKNGNSALIRLRYYGTAISVVLLDLMMPGMDGFAVLEELQHSPETRSIPVIVVSGADDRETSLKAIRGGACDFVMKPVDADILRIRVQSAVSKAENERLRAQNSFLELQSAETTRNRAVLERLHLAVAEMDWRKGTFAYSPSIAQYIAGNYDGRSLWHVFLSDMVADTQTVKKIQRLMHELADDRQRLEGAMTVSLKAPGGGKHRYNLHVYKLTNEYGLTSKVILTFKDVEGETIQATDDL